MEVLKLDYYKRLRADYLEHKSLFVAFDFDNTIFDYHGDGIDYSEVIALLKVCASLGFKLILFTGNEGDKLDTVLAHCSSIGISISHVNENPLMNTRKPYYNILLDDRAGLIESFGYLKKLTDAIRNKEI